MYTYENVMSLTAFKKMVTASVMEGLAERALTEANQAQVAFERQIELEEKMPGRIRDVMAAIPMKLTGAILCEQGGPKMVSVMVVERYEYESTRDCSVYRSQIADPYFANLRLAASQVYRLLQDADLGPELIYSAHPDVGSTEDKCLQIVVPINRLRSAILQK